MIGLLLVDVTTGYCFYGRLGVSRRDVAEIVVEIMRLGYSLCSCQLCVGQFASLVCFWAKCPKYTNIGHIIPSRALAYALYNFFTTPYIIFCLRVYKITYFENRIQKKKIVVWME